MRKSSLNPAVGTQRISGTKQDSVSSGKRLKAVHGSASLVLVRLELPHMALSE